MQVVINMPKGQYEEICSGNFDTTGYFKLNLSDAFRNGTILPEGHEKLIAEPTEGDIAKTIGGQNDFAECIREAVKAVFDNAPAVIEADAPKRRKGTPIEENDSGYNCENWIP